MHPLAQRVIDQLGGLHAFGQSQISEEASWRARFIDAYNQQLRAEEETVKMLPQVRSLVEAMSRERKLEDREEEDEEAQKR